MDVKSTDAISAGIDLANQLFKFMDDLLKFFPDYEQKKVEQFHEHHQRYLNEIVKDFHFRDDNRIDWHRDQMLLLFQDFNTYITKVAKEKNLK
jgi:hypothetical protein